MVSGNEILDVTKGSNAWRPQDESSPCGQIIPTVLGKLISDPEREKPIES